MSYAIEARKVAGVVKEANFAIAGKGFNHGEIILGLAELTARVIVESGRDSIQMDEMKAAVVSHLDRTISIGSHATGKSVIERV
jgi:hypothetical protein